MRPRVAAGGLAKDRPRTFAGNTSVRCRATRHRPDAQSPEALLRSAQRPAEERLPNDALSSYEV